MQRTNGTWGRGLGVLALGLALTAFAALPAQAQKISDSWFLSLQLEASSSLSLTGGGEDTDPPPPPPAGGGYERVTGGEDTDPPPPPPAGGGYERVAFDDPAYGAVSGAGLHAPGATARVENYPNPFNPETTIQFEVLQRQPVRLTVYNMLGQAVARLVEGVVEAGTHDVRFSAEQLPSGLYLARLETSSSVVTRRMVLAK